MKFEKLDVWKRSASLSAAIYLQLQELKDYGFKDQITRSGLSIPSNISEGMTRESAKEKAQFLNIALGSAAELKTQIWIGLKIQYIPSTIGKAWLTEVTEISAMITSLRKRIKAQ